MSKQKPILFSTPMVQAILDGRKTQTRRVIKSKHESGLLRIGRRKSDGIVTEVTSLDWDECLINDSTNDIHPKYKVGDILWVKEIHYAFGVWVKNGITKKENQKWCFRPVNNNYLYLDNAPETFKKSRNKVNPDIPAWYKRNSLFMPKEAARIFLEVADVRVERLQDISMKDAKAEGVLSIDNAQKDDIFRSPSFYDYIEKAFKRMTPRSSFETLWESINGDRSWEENPYVWVYDFKMKNEK